MSSPEADLLRVAADASLDELKRAYRKAALAHHPDQNPHPEAARHFRRLTEAYRLLAEKAEHRLPPRPPKPISPAQRVEFLLLDVRGLLRRWPVERWSQVSEGLPARVWVAGALEALLEAWPGAGFVSVDPTPEGLGRAVEAWTPRLTSEAIPAFSRQQTRRLTAVIEIAEARLRALQAPPRKGRRSEP